ncbi:MAG: tRNA (N(6)-L-threonylcarbamoyladenosine(37)-C(2))-methylthiotransferase MtaB [Nitrospira sp.]|nr:tRNA (N(6)-L-threonylcarbamoyladenosine(37)-C(2))-methylthiotransferase MtaB [Candidatus Manganitrophaceae bacterium]HIL33993.1 tRNA (N(6)-L-threonylcarbamoyladenosine(37)-C(2))-methylthiotransferase MtaB [Candidatus Manganitrophaceae bacterium]
MLIQIDPNPTIASRPELRVSLHALGCRLNHSESVSIGGTFHHAGFQVVSDGQPADLSIINSCAVTEQAEAKCRALVRRILKKKPDTFIAVTGCYAQTSVDSLKEIRGIDLIAGTDQKMELASLVQSLIQVRRDKGDASGMQGGEVLLKQSRPLVFHTPKIRRGDFTIETERFAVFDHTTRPNIKIQDGCDFFCTFCIIPYSRGRSRSRRMDDILLEVSAWVARGHREIVLTGVNLGEYATEEGGLSDLIDALEGIEGLRRIRISSIEPTTITSRLLDQFLNSKKLCPYLHLPLQSGSDRILSLMGRRYTQKEYVDFVKTVTAMIPHLCLGTDVMVGFPGEGETEFQETVSLIESLPFSYLHVFPFSRRKGTRLNRMSLTPVPPSTVKERSRVLCDYSRQIRRNYYHAFMGQRVEVLFETRNKDGLFCGLTGNYIRVGVSSEQDLSGHLMWVRIQRIENGLAIGEITG